MWLLKNVNQLGQLTNMTEKDSCLFGIWVVFKQDAVQSDRDDPDQPLVTPPFGHASQV
jgi:hypothetical protein